MAKYLAGPLHDVFPEIRVITVRDRRQIVYLYMPKGMFTSFMQYFAKGIYVFMTVSDSTRKYRGVLVRQVENIDKIMYPDGQNPRVFFDISLIKSGIKNILNAKRNRLFVDFEMSMPPFRDWTHFVSEIIQAGIVVVDEDGNTVEKLSTFIKPTLFPQITDRTRKFLHIRQDAIDGGMAYPDFYKVFSEMIRKYRPMVFVWGQNDQIELKKSMIGNNLPDITPRMQVIDLLKLHKNYFSLKNDLGLFNAFRLYHPDVLPEKQAHDAFEDASVTKAVFDGFRQVCNGELTIVPPKDPGMDNGEKAEPVPPTPAAPAA